MPSRSLTCGTEYEGERHPLELVQYTTIINLRRWTQLRNARSKTQAGKYVMSGVLQLYISHASYVQVFR